MSNKKYEFEKCKFEIGDIVKSNNYKIYNKFITGIKYVENYGYDIEVDENDEWYSDDWFEFDTKCKYCEFEEGEDLSKVDSISVWIDDSIMTVEYDGKDEFQYIVAGVNIPINYCPICGRKL